MKTRLGVLFFIVIAALGPASGSELSDYLSEGTLKEAVTLTEAQEGFVGVAGMSWVVEPSGAWRISNFVNQQVQEPKERGQLNKEQMAVVAGLLASEKYSDLPPRFGRDVQVNRLLLSISFGQMTKTLILNPGEAADVKVVDTFAPSRVGAARNFLRIFEGIKNLLQKN